MSTTDSEQEKARLEQESNIQRQIAFASGIFQDDVTIRTLLESLVEGVVVINNSGIILLANTRAEQMFGYPSKELVGKPHSMLIPERFRKAHEEYEAHYFEKPKIRPMGLLPDFTGLHRDGTEFPVEISLTFIESINGILVLAFINDITLRKQYESSLQRSEELSTVLGVMDYAIFVLDTDGNVRSWNVSAERLNGYRNGEITGKHFSFFYPEEDRAGGKPTDLLKIAAADGRAEDEGWMIRKDGSRFWADVIITTIRDENGNLRGFSNATRDITDRKQAEDALRFSEARYRALFRDNPCMIFTLDEKLMTLSVNPTCSDQLGYAINELEGLSALNIFHEDDRPTVTEQLRLCLQNPDQVHRWQFRKVRKDGAVLWVEEIAQVIHDLAGAVNILVVCQDITERKRTEEALRVNEEQLRLAMEAADLGNWELDLTTDTASVHSLRHDQMFGYQERQPQWGQAIALRHVIPEDQPIFKEAFTRARQTGVLSFEVRVRWPDGCIHWIAPLGRTYYNRDGLPVRMSGIVADITEHKRAEEEIARLNTDLTVRANELETANLELEAFNYTVAHDLRKPLTVVNGYCQAIEELCGNILDEECKGYLREAYDGTLRMNRLIDALLKFSSMAQVEPKRIAVELSTMAHEVGEELKLAEPARRVTFRIHDAIVAEADPDLLRAVLANLFGNAWKYTSNRGEAVIEFGATEIEGAPVYFVRDNGSGFDPANAGKMFAPFHRLEADKEVGGLGIGLATVARIIQRHGGKLWAEGAPDKGACFYFTLSADGNP